MTTSVLSRIEERLWPKGFSREVWMIVDAARDSRVFSMLLDSHLEYSCLYSGPLQPELELAAPYLVQLDYDSRATRRLIQQAWGNNWGVFLRSDARLESLRRHLRGLLVVRDTRGNRLVFRYYDPRVLRPYLPTCTADELRTVFGPIQCFWVEEEDPLLAVEFLFDRFRLLSNTFSLGAAEAHDGR